MAKLKIEDFYTSFHKVKSPTVELSMYEKISHFEKSENGTITTPHVLDSNGNTKVFQTEADYETWKTDSLSNLNSEITHKLNPQDYWLTQLKGKYFKFLQYLNNLIILNIPNKSNTGIERPFTGKYWDVNKVGVYACKVCTQRIFRYIILVI